MFFPPSIKAPPSKSGLSTRAVGKEPFQAVQLKSSLPLLPPMESSDIWPIMRSMGL